MMTLEYVPILHTRDTATAVFFFLKKNFFILYVRTREGYSTLSVLITYMYSCAVLELSTLHLVICC